MNTPISTSERDQELFWKKYYDSLAERGVEWLDYGNERVQRQSLELALAHANPLAATRCIDIGCGRGQLALALVERGVAEVVGGDASSALVERLKQDYPGVTWHDYSLLQPPGPALKSKFDRVFAVEVLQYVPLLTGIRHLWEFTAAGGRLVGVVPNRDCPFLANAIARFEGYYAPVSIDELESAMTSLDKAARPRLSGMWYTQQPDGPPYRVGPVSDTVQAGPPNRLIFTIDRLPD